jgi:peptide/nickel transport system substrate-binding protein
MVNDSQPLAGRTLRLFGPGEITRLDPACYHPDTASSQVNRLFCRQLFSYRPEHDLRSWQAIAPVPDLAVEIPSIYNAGLGASGTTYVVHLRSGVYWDTSPPRELVADDVIRGLKRMGNPVLRSPLLPYFLTTIRGFRQFCDDYRAAVRDRGPDPDALARYQNSHEIAGVFALDDHTLIFELARPTLAFANILALPCASPAPAEYDALVPNSPEFPAAVRSSGPYRPIAVTRNRLLLDRNPAWHQATDPIRGQYLDDVEIARGPASDVVRLIEAGAADLPWGLTLPLPGGPPEEQRTGLGHSLDPYLVLNVVSPRADRALSKPGVRSAIAGSIDKAVLADLAREVDPGRAAQPADGLIPTDNDGHAGAGSAPRPDLAHARALLAVAGYAESLTLTAVCPALPPYPEITRAVAADLAKVGITVDVAELAPEEHHALLEDPEQAYRGTWDLGCLSWSPTWLHCNRQVFLQPLVQASPWRGTANCGQYRNPDVDTLMEDALGAVDPWQADALWRAVEQALDEDCAVVPLLFRAPPAAPRHSRRVRGSTRLPAFGHAIDLANVRLEGADVESYQVGGRR